VAVEKKVLFYLRIDLTPTHASSDTNELVGSNEQTLMAADKGTTFTLNMLHCQRDYPCQRMLKIYQMARLSAQFVPPVVRVAILTNFRKPSKSWAALKKKKEPSVVEQMMALWMRQRICHKTIWLLL